MSVPGGIAQLGEHLLCKQGVVGSIPSASTTHQRQVFGFEYFALAIEPVRATEVRVDCRSLTIWKK